MGATGSTNYQLGNHMSFIPTLRANLNRALTWLEADANITGLADAASSAQTAAGSAQSTANAAALAAASAAQLNASQTFSGAQRGAVSALTYAATITPDFAVDNNFSVTLTGSATLATPSNLVAGQSGVITITQDGTGSRTMAFGSAWKFLAGTAPSLTTTAGAVDDLAYYVESSTRIVATLIGNVK